MTTRALNARVEEIRRKHGVVVKAGNPLSRCWLFGNLPGLLDRIDRDLDACPQYFKDNIGPVLIEESFADNPPTYPLSLFLRGYVYGREQAERFPIHIKNRSLLEKLVLYAPGDDELFLHEATHSFEFTMETYHRGYWERFKGRYDDSRAMPYGGVVASLACAALFPLSFTRPPGMPSFFGWVDHWEDVAETHCYLRRRADRVPGLRTRDRAFYEKCLLVGEFTRGPLGAEPPLPSCPSAEKGAGPQR